MNRKSLLAIMAMIFYICSITSPVYAERSRQSSPGQFKKQSSDKARIVDKIDIGTSINKVRSLRKQVGEEMKNIKQTQDLIDQEKQKIVRYEKEIKSKLDSLQQSKKRLNRSQLNLVQERLESVQQSRQLLQNNTKTHPDGWQPSPSDINSGNQSEVMSRIEKYKTWQGQQLEIMKKLSDDLSQLSKVLN